MIDTSARHGDAHGFYQRHPQAREAVFVTADSFEHALAALDGA